MLARSQSEERLTVGNRIFVVSLACLAVAALGCSKTEDTAPERRIFGSPPTINSVETTASSSVTATCDWTQISQGAMCSTYFTDPSLFAQPFPTITLTLNYTEITFTINVTDPESKLPAQTDVLLVTASYLETQGVTQETSLVTLDDGSENSFPYTQLHAVFENCYDNDHNYTPCACSQANYQLNTNDLDKGDSNYTRAFAFIDLNGFRTRTLFEDCLAASKHQAAGNVSNLAPGQPVEFKIEAIDRSGNLSVWPARPAITPAPSTITCTGDECMCCLLFNGDETCAQKPGLLGTPTSGFASGWCKQF
jgi:hypothetical protein